MKQGGDPFLISLTEEFPDDVRTAVVEFKGVCIIDNATVLNPFTLYGTVPRKYKCQRIAVKNRLTQSTMNR